MRKNKVLNLGHLDFDIVSNFDIRISDFSLPDNSLPSMMIQSTQLSDYVLPAGLFMSTQPQSCAIGTCAIGIIANRRNPQESTSTRFLSMSLGNPAGCFMQNKPNLVRLLPAVYPPRFLAGLPAACPPLARRLPAACPPFVWRVRLAGSSGGSVWRAGGFKTLYLTKAYEKNAKFSPTKNKPKQTQLVAAKRPCRGEVLYEAGIAKPDQTQFQTPRLLIDPQHQGPPVSCACWLPPHRPLLSNLSAINCAQWPAGPGVSATVP
ncbi:MAG: hypothetical protein ACYTEQ_06000 [Planctomycetota bacterium]|jgi:hypothetical protein